MKYLDLHNHYGSVYVLNKNGQYMVGLDSDYNERPPKPISKRLYDLLVAELGMPPAKDQDEKKQEAVPHFGGLCRGGAVFLVDDMQAAREPNPLGAPRFDADSELDAANKYLRSLECDNELEARAYTLWVREEREGAEWVCFQCHVELVFEWSLRQVIQCSDI